jgi:thioesterase domain-containing protein
MRVPALTRSVGDATDSLVWVQRGSTGPPVYCFHPLGGSVAVYGQLALRLGCDQPVRGLQAIGLVPGRDPDQTVDAMARRYAAEIVATRPPRRPVLVGYSMGGTLAVEAARLLAPALPESPVVFTIDCDPLYTSSDNTEGWRILVHQVLAIDLPTEPLAGMPVEEGLALVRAAGAAQRRIPVRFDLDRLHTMLRVCQVNERAIAAHVPQPYAGTVHVVRPAAAGPVAGADPWNGFADRVEVSVVPADHQTILGPLGCSEVAALIRRLLDRRRRGLSATEGSPS